MPSASFLRLEKALRSPSPLRGKDKGRGDLTRSRTPILIFSRRETVSQRMGSGVSSRTNVRDLRFLPAVEMTERLTRRCFRYYDTVSRGGRNCSNDCDTYRLLWRY